MSRARAREIICKYCGRPAPNNMKPGPQRQYHRACYDKLRTERMQERRSDPEYRRAENERQNERRARNNRDPKKRELARARQRNRRRKERDQAAMYRKLEPLLLQLANELEVTNQRIDEISLIHGQRIHALEQQQPGGKALGL